MRKSPPLLALVGALALAGCGAPGAVTEAFALHRPTSTTALAVLPFANETTDMDGPLIMREFFVEVLRRRRYVSAPVEELDAALRSNGITHGWQLAAVEPEALGEVLGVDYLVYGTVERFVPTRIPLFPWSIIRWVKAVFRLVHAPTGKELWSAVGEVKIRDYQFLRQSFRTDLRAESRKAVKKALSTLPAGE
jgi:hypothetical protein